MEASRPIARGKGNASQGRTGLKEGMMMNVLYNTAFLIAALVCGLSAVILLISLIAANRPLTPPSSSNPQKPREALMEAGYATGNARHAKQHTRRRALILMLLSICLMVYTYPRASLALPNPMMTTVGQLRKELAALADQTPTAFTYTESNGSPDTFVLTVDDPDIARQALDIILSTPVNRLGCQVDMYQLQYEEYRFTFGEETYTFSFVPHSYFCDGGQYYELGENRLGRMRDFLHEMAAEASVTPQSSKGL